MERGLKSIQKDKKREDENYTLRRTYLGPGGPNNYKEVLSLLNILAVAWERRRQDYGRRGGGEGGEEESVSGSGG